MSAIYAYVPMPERTGDAVARAMAKKFEDLIGAIRTLREPAARADVPCSWYVPAPWLANQVLCGLTERIAVLVLAYVVLDELGCAAEAEPILSTIRREAETIALWCGPLSDEQGDQLVQYVVPESALEQILRKVAYETNLGRRA